MQNIVIKYVVDDAGLVRARTRSQEAQKATDDLRNSTNKYSKDVKNAGDQGQKAFSGIATAVKTISFVLVAKELLDFTKQVIAVRGEFQKFEAVLTNTLGSRSAALIALGRINEFAKSTPFGVKELTENFVKLANRGIQPTIQQMRAIADLSATLGKDFSQVVEAILDINNPERWKEIGVKAETAGNKVKLTFRGVTEEVDRTVQGVTDAVVALGQLNGVAGSTEAISKTLAGQTSNLSDAWEQLLNTIGKGNEGVLFEAVSLLGRAIEKANELLKTNDQRFEERQSRVLATETEDFEKLAQALGSVAKAEELYNQKRQDRMKQISEQQAKLMNQEVTTKENRLFNHEEELKEGLEALEAREKELTSLRELYDIYNTDLPKAIQESIKKIQAKEIADKAAAQATREKAAADREAELAERRRGSGGSGLKELDQTVNLDLKNPVTGEVGKYDKDNIIKAFTDMVNLVPEGEIPPLKQPVEIVMMSDLERGLEDNKEELKRAGLALTEDILRSQIDSEMAAYDERINAARDFYDEQVQLAGDNERAKKELRIREDREIKELEKQRADREKKSILASILANTALSVIKIFSGEGTYIDKLIRAGIMTAEGASQYAIASRARYYAKGEINIKGPGSETSDSIPAFLSKGESIMTAKQTREAFGILTDVRAGKLNDKIFKQISVNGGSQVFDDSRIVSAIRNQPKPPDVVRQHKDIYQVIKDKEGNKRRIRSKAI